MIYCKFLFLILYCKNNVIDNCKLPYLPVYSRVSEGKNSPLKSLIGTRWVHFHEQESAENAPLWTKNVTFLHENIHNIVNEFRSRLIGKIPVFCLEKLLSAYTLVNTVYNMTFQTIFITMVFLFINLLSPPSPWGFLCVVWLMCFNDVCFPFLPSTFIPGQHRAFRVRAGSSYSIRASRVILFFFRIQLLIRAWSHLVT
jgi:hypothetical protein